MQVFTDFCLKLWNKHGSPPGLQGRKKICGSLYCLRVVFASDEMKRHLTMAKCGAGRQNAVEVERPRSGGVRFQYLLRWRTASKRRMAAACATFKESTWPAMGMRMGSARCQIGLTPA